MRALSAFSGQLLNEDGEHAFDFGDLLRQILLVAGWGQLQVVSQEDLVFQLDGRAAGDQAKEG